MSRLALPEAVWPLQDLNFVDALFAAGGPLDDAGPLCRLRPVSQASLRVAYGRWLGWVARQHPESLVQSSPVARATPELFRDWVASMRHLASETQLSQAVKVLRVLKAAAPNGDWRSASRAAGTVTATGWSVASSRIAHP
jgi:hypothetical protein